MSILTGARLQNAGQVRNTEHIVNQAYSATVQWASGTHTRALLSVLGQPIPFDLGPDKASQVFVRIHGVEVLLSADSFVGTPTLDGFMYYQPPNNKRVYLKAIRQVLTANFPLSLDRQFFSDYSYNAESVDNIGYIAFENNASALGGTATFISMICRVNVGLYSIYSEPDFDQLNRIPPHEHSGLPYGIDIQV